MVDIDEEFVNLCKVYLPEWSDCSDIIGSSGGSCFDDERAKVYFEDAFKYFIDKYGDNSTWSEEDEEELFDVIIMDACDPTDEFVDKLYKSSLCVLTKSLIHLLCCLKILIFLCFRDRSGLSGHFIMH